MADNERPVGEVTGRRARAQILGVLLEHVLSTSTSSTTSSSATHERWVSLARRGALIRRGPITDFGDDRSQAATFGVGR
jgi:hypothetical protein